MKIASLLTKTGLTETSIDNGMATKLVEQWMPRHIPKGGFIVRQGDEDAFEYMILSGSAVSHISDAEGRNVCVAFHLGPAIITPNIARQRAQTSLVNIEIVSDALIASMPSKELLALMVANEEVREWANAILRNEIGFKAEREWCLAALGGADRLDWFRGRYPKLENLFGHAYIASFLGLTPVTLSRLRNRIK